MIAEIRINTTAKTDTKNLVLQIENITLLIRLFFNNKLPSTKPESKFCLFRGINKKIHLRNIQHP